MAENRLDRLTGGYRPQQRNFVAIFVVAFRLLDDFDAAADVGSPFYQSLTFQGDKIA